MSNAFSLLTNPEKINYILDGLSQGKTREELAEELGYKNYKSMDIFVRRQGYSWERSRMIYVPTGDRNSGRYATVSTLSPNAKSSKVREIISLFSQGELTSKDISKKVGFEDHREMALYLKSQGYVWDSERSNYVLEPNSTTTVSPVESVSSSPSCVTNPRESTNYADSENSLRKYLPILELLEQNQEVLRHLLKENSVVTSGGSLPRYSIPGVFVTKSVHMSTLLDQLVRDYSEQKNISQRDIFEIALVEFFKKYSFEKEIETLLSQGS